MDAKFYLTIELADVVGLLLAVQRPDLYIQCLLLFCHLHILVDQVHP